LTFICSFALLAGAGTPVRCAGHPHRDVQNLGPAATGKPSPTATTNSLASFSSQAAEANGCRPNLWVWLRRVWGDWKSALLIVKAIISSKWRRFHAHISLLQRNLTVPNPMSSRAGMDGSIKPSPDSPTTPDLPKWQRM